MHVFAQMKTKITQIPQHIATQMIAAATALVLI